MDPVPLTPLPRPPLYCRNTSAVGSTTVLAVVILSAPIQPLASSGSVVTTTFTPRLMASLRA